MKEKIEEFFGNNKNNIIYLNYKNLNKLTELLETYDNDFEVYNVRLKGSKSKNDVLISFAKTLYFPNNFGMNWDALKDCLIDLSWISASGYVIIITGLEEFKENNFDEYRTLIEILEYCVFEWVNRNKEYYIFIAT